MLTLQNLFSRIFKRFSHRRKSDSVKYAEIATLEKRTLLASAGADSAWTYHDSTLYDTVAGNDVWTGTPTFAWIHLPSHGQLDLDESTGSFSYTPESGFIGIDTFQYRLTDYEGSEGASIAWVTISVSNEAPSFEAYTEWDSGELELGGNDTLFSTDSYLGQLLATDLEGDNLTFTGSSSPYLEILTDGRIKVTDGPGLTELVATQGGSVQISVFVTDGIASVQSMVRVALTPWGHTVQSEIYLEDSDGTVWDVTTAEDLKAALEGIQLAGDTVTSLIIKGHGGGGAIFVGDDEVALTIASGTIYLGDDDITQLLLDVTDASTEIRFRGCHTAPLARSVENALDGAKVFGAVRFIIGIPGTCWAIGVYN